MEMPTSTTAFKKQACSKNLAGIPEYAEKACSKKAKDKIDTENNNTAVIYARVSSIGDRQNTERQVSDLTALSSRMGLTLEKVYEEHVSGAKKNTERPILTECLDYCKSRHIGVLLVSELSRLGRNTFEVLSTVKDLMDCGINVYFQKEQMSLLDESGRPSMFTPILIATLGTCAEMERENIRFRLNSGLANYKAKGGHVGRKAGSVKSDETKKEEYRDVIALLKRGYSVRNTAKLTGKGISTVQRLKNDFVN